MPVLPLVGSISVVWPGVMMPCFSSASTMLTPIRSLTEEIGLKNSSFSRMSALAPTSLGMRFIRTSGVSPIVWVIES